VAAMFVLLLLGRGVPWVLRTNNRHRHLVKFGGSRGTPPVVGLSSFRVPRPHKYTRAPARNHTPLYYYCAFFTFCLLCVSTMSSIPRMGLPRPRSADNLTSLVNNGGGSGSGTGGNVKRLYVRSSSHDKLTALLSNSPAGNGQDSPQRRHYGREEVGGGSHGGVHNNIVSRPVAITAAPSEVRSGEVNDDGRGGKTPVVSRVVPPLDIPRVTKPVNADSDSDDSEVTPRDMVGDMDGGGGGGGEDSPTRELRQDSASFLAKHVLDASFGCLIRTGSGLKRRALNAMLSSPPRAGRATVDEEEDNAADTKEQEVSPSL
jgi:hypothetical protein